MPPRLEGTSAIVTGAASGIGRAAALLFAREGAAVTCVDRDSRALAGVRGAIEAAGGRALDVPADVTVQGDLEHAAAAALEAFGSIDVLFANAGVEGPGRAHEISRDDWDRVIGVNLTGTWLSVRAVLPAMLARGRGSLVLQSSVAATTGARGLAAYSAAKAGVLGLTRQLAVDYGPQGIRANAICPGTIRTPMMSRLYASGFGMAGGDARSEEEIVARAAAGIPLRRIGEPADVAAWALFLASDESAWTNGGVFVVDGGATAD